MVTLAVVIPESELARQCSLQAIPLTLFIAKYRSHFMVRTVRNRVDTGRTGFIVVLVLAILVQPISSSAFSQSKAHGLFRPQDAPKPSPEKMCEEGTKDANETIDYLENQLKSKKAELNAARSQSEKERAKNEISDLENRLQEMKQIFKDLNKACKGCCGGGGNPDGSQQPGPDDGMSEKGTNGKPSSKNKSSSKNPTPGNSTGISNNEYEELAKMEHNEGLGLAATGATVVVGGIVLAAGATAAAPIAVGVVLVGVGGTLVAVGIQKIQFAKDAFKFYAATDED